jgi:protocatechuate 3,4-dioxygenase beta subunit
MLPSPEFEMHDDEFEKGLQHDLIRMLPNRRQVLLWISAAAVVGCNGESKADSAPDRNPLDTDTDTDPIDTDTDLDTDVETDVDTDGETCTAIPEETAGPYPGDGSNGANVLTDAGVVRQDIRRSIGSASGVAEGVLLTLRMRLVNTNAGCRPLVGYAIYVWQCDREALYSMYTLADQNYLRGVQVTDADGWVTFTSIFPGCYPGRWPHIHFEMFPSVTAIASDENVVSISQLAFPEESCTAAYAAPGYSQSLADLAGVSLEGDSVFRGGAGQIATVTGNVTDGFVAELTVAIAG